MQVLGTLKSVSPFGVVATIAALLATPAWGELLLEAEVNPDPAAVGELVDVQITVSNTSATSGNLTLQFEWPAELATTPFTTGGGSCPGGTCSDGELMTWNLPTLAMGESVTVGFNEDVSSGTSIPIEIELFESGESAATLSHAIEISANSPLEIAVDPLSDPAASEGVLVYELVYSNSSTTDAVNARLEFPLPVGTQLQSAGDGVLAGESVVWDLGAIAPRDGGRKRVYVTVDDLPAGTPLVVDSAVLSAELDFLGQESRAAAISRVDAVALALALESNPDSAATGEMVDSQILVSNLSEALSGALTLRVLWPEELASTPFVAGDGGCDGNCSSGEYLVWNLGMIAPTSEVTVGFMENPATATEGRLIPLEMELLESDVPAWVASSTAVIHPFTDNDTDGEADILDEDDDNDGMPDWYELTISGLDPFDPTDAQEDFDDDGLTNLEECVLGTDPNDPDTDNDGRSDKRDPDPLTPAPNQCEGSDVVLTDRSFGDGEVFDCRASGSIRTQGTFSVGAGADVLLMSGVVEIGTGFEALEGALFFAVSATEIAP